MKRYYWIITLVLILAAIFLTKTFSVTDISHQAETIKNKTLSVLGPRGFTEDNILFKTGGGWRRLNVLGHTYTYVSKPYMRFKKDGLTEEIKETLSDVKGYIDVRSSPRGTDGSFRLSVLCDGYVVFSFTATEPDLVVKEMTKEKVREKMPTRIKPVPVILKEPSGKTVKIALVLDDLGYSDKNLDKIKELGVPITLAVLPNLRYTDKVCSFAEKNGFDTILHFPMEPLKENAVLEKDTVLVKMTDEEIKPILSAALRSVRKAKGVNNHMGSKATQDMRVMRTVFSELKKRDLLFLDSYTVAGSICSQAAKEEGIKFFQRDVFLDHIADEEKIAGSMDKAVSIAMKNGRAIAIGHDKAVTIDTLAKIIPEMKEKGIKFVKLADLAGKK